MTVFIVGAIGFLAGLVSHDLGAQGLSEDRPLRPLRGSCPTCGAGRGWQRLRCATCGRVIEREPFLALTSALVAVGIYNTVGLHWELIPYAGFLLLSASLLVTDLEELRIVDRLNLPGSALLAVLLAIAAVAGGNLDDLWRGLLGAVVYFGGATLLWLVVRGRAFGAGDVKLAPLLGLFTAYLSWRALGQAVFATAMIGGVIAIALLSMGRARMETELPYGPPMVLGAWLAIVMAGIGSFAFGS